jgi:Na+-translocating ferredoxin:NAD+ oxidoreductase subunit D
MEPRSFNVSYAPHVHDGSSTRRIMWTVFGALAPAAAVAVYAFGLDALRVMLLSTVLCVAMEWIALLIMRRDPMACLDGSAALTGFLLGLTLPAGLSGGIIVVGAFVAVIVAKQVFGGLGHNPFNPALTSRVFLLIAFPKQLTTWPVPRGLEDIKEYMGLAVTRTTDAVTSATPLAAIKEHAQRAMPNIQLNDLFFGVHTPGSIGEISALALLLGAAFLLYRRIITWHVPVATLATVAVLGGLTHLVNPAKYADPVFHLFAGGLFIGAFFMATDYVTAPVWPKGKIIYGVGIGLLTMVIRLWGGYPEGISFAILLMNAATPLLDRYTVPTPFGSRKPDQAAPGKAGGES